MKHRDIRFPSHPNGADETKKGGRNKLISNEGQGLGGFNIPPGKYDVKRRDSRAGAKRIKKAPAGYWRGGACRS